MIDAVLLFLLCVVPILVLVVVQDGLSRLLAGPVFSNAIARRTYYVTAVLGVSVHELSHAIVAVLGGHRVRKISLFEFSHSHSRLGYVNHSYNPNSIYQRAALFYIGIAPIFGACAVIWLSTKFLMPDALPLLSRIAQLPVVHMQHSVDVWLILDLFLKSSLATVNAVYAASSSSNFFLWLAIVSIVSFHSVPSRADLKNASTGVGYLLAIFLIAVLLSGFFGFELVFAKVISLWFSVCMFMSVTVTLSLVWWSLLLIPFIAERLIKASSSILENK